MKAERNGARYAAVMGILLAAALLLGYIESLIPFDFAIPGIKLGLPNMMTLIVLRKKGIAHALPFGLLRALLSNLLFGSALSLAYAAGGCVISVAAMALAGRIRAFGICGQSVLGALGHNIGQIAVAAVAVSTPAIIWYLPFLMVSGAIAGFLIGIAAAGILQKGGKWLQI